MLSTTQRRTIEQQLRTARAQAVRLVGDSTAEQVSGEDTPDLVDRAALEAERHLDQIVATREAERIGVIDDALRRLMTEPDTFGACSVCRRPISVDRLALIPWTTVCELHAGASR